MYPLTNKRSTTTATIFQKWLSNGIPKNLNSDDGSEWKGKFKELINKHKIIHHISVGTDEMHTKQAIVERVHRTIREMIGRYMQINNTKKYIDVLPKLVENYNNTQHSTTGHKPYNIFKGKKENEQTIQRAPFLSIGQKVRILLNKSIFKKSGTPTWSNTVWKVIKHEKLGHIIENVETGEIKERTYKRYELLPITNFKRLEKDLEKSKIEAKKLLDDKTDKKLKREGLDSQIKPIKPRKRKERTINIGDRFQTKFNFDKPYTVIILKVLKNDVRVISQDFTESDSKNPTIEHSNIFKMPKNDLLQKLSHVKPNSRMSVVTKNYLKLKKIV